MTDRVRSSSPGQMWEYTRRVIAADECPRTVCTCLTRAPPEMSAEAVKCLRSWCRRRARCSAERRPRRASSAGTSVGRHVAGTREQHHHGAVARVHRSCERCDVVDGRRFGPGGEQVPHVALVLMTAGGAHRRSTVAAPDVQHTIPLDPRLVRAEDLAGGATAVRADPHNRTGRAQYPDAASPTTLMACVEPATSAQTLRRSFQRGSNLSTRQEPTLSRRDSATPTPVSALPRHRTTSLGSGRLKWGRRRSGTGTEVERPDTNANSIYERDLPTKLKVAGPAVGVARHGDGQQGCRATRRTRCGTRSGRILRVSEALRARLTWRAVLRCTSTPVRRRRLVQHERLPNP
jgi:hypothetical protein